MEKLEVVVEKVAETADLSQALAAYQVNVEKGVIVSNMSVIKMVMEKKREDIKNQVFAGEKKDQLAMIKKERVAVNNFKDAVSKQKTSVRKTLLEPFSEFEKEANETIDLAQKTFDDLNERAKAIEKEFREEKRRKIKEFFDGVKEPLEDFAEEFYSIVYKDEWENASTTMPKVKKELQEKIDSFVTGLSTINLMVCDADIKATAKSQYKKHMDVAVAMQYIAAETKSRAEAKAREEARIEAERKRLEAEKQAAIAAERERLEAEKQAAIAAEREHLEAEKQVAIVAERERLEAEKQVVVVAERERLEAEKKCAEEMNTASVATEIPEEENNMRICVEFLSGDEWKLVKEFCDLHAIFYSVK